jgi:hypothetical protein
VKVTYYALKGNLPGYEDRAVGDLIPEARDWPFLSAYVRDGDLGVVLVATLPAQVRKELEMWEAEQEALMQVAEDGEPEVPQPDDVPTTGAPDPEDEPQQEVPAEPQEAKV